MNLNDYFVPSVVEMAGLSRSTESSLKRTKRKAPLPPASPSVVVQDAASLDGGMNVFKWI